MRASLLLAGVVVAVAAGCAAPRITTGSLLNEMTDLAGLCEYPDPPFTCSQFSSYDRRSKTPDDPEGWFANHDSGNYLRVEQQAERKEYVMAEMDGPGAIVRIWSANPKGTLRIYLDHAERPVLEAPLADVLGGRLPGIPEPIAGVHSRGWNSYFPIPYARHCKLTSDEGGFYYHVNYRTYPPGTRVVSFRPEDFERLSGRIEQVAAALAAPRSCGLRPSGRWREMLPAEVAGRWQALPSGGARHWDLPRGPAAIVRLLVQADAADLAAALRQTLLIIEFDDERTVVCPLGDFFGTNPGINPYESLPLGMTPDGVLWSHWVMPYRDSARIELHNLGQQLVKVRLLVGGRAHRWSERSLHFCAKWRPAYDLPTRPMRDWNYLNATGRGVFVGAAFGIANPVKIWWGEGDEKIYVDGESFPSHFGTGTEDYYGYAWGSPEVFTHAYHNQPRCDGPNNYGHTSVNRWHILDRIPFERSFRFDMELWHWKDDIDVDMSVVSYWYARPGSSDGFAPPGPDDLRVVAVPPYVPPRVAGALEGEEMTVLEHTGTPERQEWSGLSNEAHLWWRGAQPGERLVLGFEAPEAGRYRVLARFLTARDYGITQLYVNDEKAGEPIDLFNDGNPKPSEEIELGVFELAAGQNRLTAEIVGTNDKAVKAYMFGLDYLRLEPVAEEK